jgi:hypothetical protein
MKVTVTERGWAGHFCAGHNCRFRRNTLIQSERDAVVVSTVGQYVPSRAAEPQEIGCERYYETMAFGATKQGEYMDADVRDERSFESPWAIDHWKGEGVDNEANAMHEAVVSEFVARMSEVES